MHEIISTHDPETRQLVLAAYEAKTAAELDEVLSNASVAQFFVLMQFVIQDKSISMWNKNTNDEFICNLKDDEHWINAQVHLQILNDNIIMTIKHNDTQKTIIQFKISKNGNIQILNVQNKDIMQSKAFDLLVTFVKLLYIFEYQINWWTSKYKH